MVEVGISCGLFHSAVLIDGQFWVFGKGDGGRLGLGHENSVFVPTLNPLLSGVKGLALGGLHSIALNSVGQLFSWSVFLVICLILITEACFMLCCCQISRYTCRYDDNHTHN